MSNTTKWVRQPQEKEGSYWFSGKFLITIGIQKLLTGEEIMTIYLEVQNLVNEKKGLAYLQVYVHSKTKQKLFFIDHRLLFYLQ